MKINREGGKREERGGRGRRSVGIMQESLHFHMHNNIMFILRISEPTEMKKQNKTRRQENMAALFTGTHTA